MDRGQETMDMSQIMNWPEAKQREMLDMLLAARRREGEVASVPPNVPPVPATVVVPVPVGAEVASYGVVSDESTSWANVTVGTPNYHFGPHVYDTNGETGTESWASNTFPGITVGDGRPSGIPQ